MVRYILFYFLFIPPRNLWTRKAVLPVCLYGAYFSRLHLEVPTLWHWFALQKTLMLQKIMWLGRIQDSSSAEIDGSPWSWVAQIHGDASIHTWGHIYLSCKEALVVGVDMQTDHCHVACELSFPLLVGQLASRTAVGVPGSGSPTV
jgi:hypothetical protein